jgi:hypothetical protein
MKVSLIALMLLAHLTAFASSTFAADDRASRKATLNEIIHATPVNPDDYFEDYFKMQASTIRDTLRKCRYDSDEMGFIDRLIALLDEELAKGSDSAAIYARIKQMPDFSPENLKAHPESAKDLEDLKGAADHAAMAKSFLRYESCRLLVRLHFEAGASRKEMLELVKQL